MPFENSMSRPGMSRNTVSILQIMPLDMTAPISKPMRNCMSISAIIPEIVVRLEDEISTIALDSAAMSASLAGLVSRSSMYR